MLRMVQAINNDHLTTLADRREPRMVVTCATCHRGIAEPRPLQQVLLTAYDAAGADSAEAAYRLQRALAINPNDPQAKTRLETLRPRE